MGLLVVKMNGRNGRGLLISPTNFLFSLPVGSKILSSVVFNNGQEQDIFKTVADTPNILAQIDNVDWSTTEFLLLIERP